MIIISDHDQRSLNHDQRSLNHDLRPVREFKITSCDFPQVIKAGVKDLTSRFYKFNFGQLWAPAYCAAI
jgi:hypothetical protein